MVDFLTETSGHLYLYGAHNQINVVQMRAKGTVSQEANDSPETERARERVRAKISGRIDSMIHKLSKREAEERFRVIERGQLFCFVPEEYAYYTYERG